MTTEENIKVLIRIRPNFGSDAKNYLSRYKESNSIIIPSESEPKIYNFDKVADENTSQEEIFKSCKELFESFFSGYNCTIFAYGQTSSGKTFTMTGGRSETKIENEPGLVPHGLKFIFDKINEINQMNNIEYLVKCSFVEIYNEQLFDLLDPKGQRVYLKINLAQGVYVDQLTEKIIGNTRDALNILHSGLSNRHVASTAMNRKSSRSHAVFSIILESCIKQGEIENIRKSVLHLVDLAGSERQRDTKSDGTRLKEAGSINKSLHVLGQVISAHVDIANGKERYIRYRESKLTQLLKDSIGGNSKTVLVACVHPDIKYTSETLSTLQFANHVKMIKNKAKVNIDVVGNVESLQKEVLHLRELLKNKGTFHSIQPQDCDVDSVWKKRFIQAMEMRRNLSTEACHLKEQLVLSHTSQRKLEGIIQNLKDEFQIKEMKIQSFQENSMRKTVDDDEMRNLVESALTRIENEVILNTDRVKMDSLQSEISSLRLELHKMKSMQSLAMSESSMVSSLYKEYNDIIESGEMDKQCDSPMVNQLEITKLQEELAEANITISQLKKKNISLKISIKDERRQLESEIASMKSMLKDIDFEKEKSASKRRQTLFNIIKQQPVSPIRNITSINLGRRNTKSNILTNINEISDSFEEFKSSPEWEIEMLSNDLKDAEIKNSKYQRMIGKLEYDIKEHVKDINELRNSLKDQEALEVNFNVLKEKYNLIEIDLQESRDMAKKLEHQLSDVLYEKEKLSKGLSEKISTLEIELEDALLEKDSFKDELEVVKSSLDLLRGEFLKNPDSFSVQENNYFSKDESREISVIKSNNEEIFKLIEELSEANELISELKANESEHVDQIFDLEKRLIDGQNKIEELRQNIETMSFIHNQKLEELRVKDLKEIEELISRLEMSEALNGDYRIEFDKLLSELNMVNKDLETLKSLQTSATENCVGVPSVTSSPLVKSDQIQSERVSLLEELLSTSEQLEKDLQSEKQKVTDIKLMLENIFKISEISLDCSLLDNVKSLEATIISYKKDIEDYRKFSIHKNDEINTKNNYIYELSKNLTVANEQRKSLKEQNDQLITSYGHTNYKQKIKMMTKLKDDLFVSRNENLMLSRKLVTMTMQVNKCDKAIREFILNGVDENLDPNVNYT